MANVGAGSALVKQAGATMDGIVAAVQRMTGIMAEIAGASQEQSTGIAQVDRAISQLDDATRQNATLVEDALRANSRPSTPTGRQHAPLTASVRSGWA